MPNHVHLLVTPHVAPPKLLKSVKNFSAKRANELLGRKGNPFWQSESYDRWVRSEVWISLATGYPWAGEFEQVYENLERGEPLRC